MFMIRPCVISLCLHFRIVVFFKSHISNFVVVSSYLTGVRTYLFDRAHCNAYFKYLNPNFNN